jgi:hypothetical protein
VQYNTGDIVDYTAFGGVERTVRISVVLQDVKNGRPGFDGVLQVRDASGRWVDSDEPFRSVWGYYHQITRVHK